MFRFFKTKESNQLKETIGAMQISLKKSFNNIKKDFSTIDTHHKTFHEKHEKHDQAHGEHRNSIKQLNERITSIERALNQIQDIGYTPTKVSVESDFDEIESMTEVSQKICYILAALMQEDKELVTLKSLAEEMYPGKEYAKIRSTISQYTTELEELGYVQKKKKGKHVYIKSTEKNPFLKEKRDIKKKIKAKA